MSEQELRRYAGEVAHDVLAGVPAAIEGVTDPTERFLLTRPFYGRLIEAGLLRRLLPVDVGGDGEGLMDAAIVAEELMAVEPGVALTLFATSLGIAPVVYAGTAAQRRKLLAPFLETTGTPLAAFGLTEPGGSANVDAPDGIRTTAARVGRGWVINGSKKWVSSISGWDGRGADLTCLVCRAPEGPTILAVRGPIAGIRVDDVVPTLGFHAHLTPTVTYTDVRATAGNVVGKPGAGAAVIGAAFLPAIARVGVFAVALMRTAFEFALAFARTEHRGGAVPIIEHQAVGYALANAKTRLEAVRSLAWRACAAVDAGAPNARELALHAKIFGSETAVQEIADLMGVVGVDGYDTRLPLGGLLQDALALPVFGGSNNGVRRRQLHTLLR